jgi:hypothetical protein
MEKHNVVQAEEFTPEFYERKAQERANFHNGVRTTREIQQDRQQIHEVWNQVERGYKPNIEEYDGDHNEWR